MYKTLKFDEWMNELTNDEMAVQGDKQCLGTVQLLQSDMGVPMTHMHELLSVKYFDLELFM